MSPKQRPKSPERPRAAKLSTEREAPELQRGAVRRQKKKATPAFTVLTHKLPYFRVNWVKTKLALEKERVAPRARK